MSDPLWSQAELTQAFGAPPSAASTRRSAACRSTRARFKPAICFSRSKAIPATAMTMSRALSRLAPALASSRRRGGRTWRPWPAVWRRRHIARDGASWRRLARANACADRRGDGFRRQDQRQGNVARRAWRRPAPTHASAASYNNHWGVPLTLARMPAQRAFGVFEIGMNHAGEITPLVAMVRPHVALITTIAPVHIEHLGSLEAIAEAKAEIFSGVEPGGTIVAQSRRAAICLA